MYHKYWKYSLYRKIHERLYFWKAFSGTSKKVSLKDLSIRRMIIRILSYLCQWWLLWVPINDRGWQNQASADIIFGLLDLILKVQSIFSTANVSTTLHIYEIMQKTWFTKYLSHFPQSNDNNSHKKFCYLFENISPRRYRPYVSSWFMTSSCDFTDL